MISEKRTYMPLKLKTLFMLVLCCVWVRSQRFVSGLTCETQCQLDPNFTSVCATDGQLYLSECHAQCKNSSLSEMFNCGSMNIGVCAEKCKRRGCYLNCPPSSTNRHICASNGGIYMNSCEARCDGKENRQLFVCERNDLEDCAKRCQSEARNPCLNRCPNSPFHNQICASDGFLYNNECKSKCKDSNNKQLFACALNDSDCRLQCESAKAVEDCKNSCPAPSKDQLQCASNSQLYPDLCHAKCEDSNVVMAFDCGFPIEQSICELRCDKFVERCIRCTRKGTKPVCGGDGKIYRNECEADCLTGTTLYELIGSINKREAAECKAFSLVEECKKDCSTRDRFVCASDGFVYKNDCVARCSGHSVKFPCQNGVRQCNQACSL